MKTVHSNLAPLASLCRDTGRFATDRVRLAMRGEEYEATATNSKVAIQVVGGLDTNNTPDARSGSVALVDAATWKQVFLRAKKARCKAVAVGIGDTDTEFIAGGTTDRVERWDGLFPNISAYIPNVPCNVTVKLMVKELVSLVKVIKDVAGDEALINLDIYDSEKPVVIRVVTESQKITGLIAPCS